MTDPKQSAPDPLPPQTFYTVEIQGGCEEMHAGACQVMELAIESAMALLKVNFSVKKNSPKVILHRPGTFDLGKVGS